MLKRKLNEAQKEQASKRQYLGKDFLTTDPSKMNDLKYRAAGILLFRPGSPGRPGGFILMANERRPKKADSKEREKAAFALIGGKIANQDQGPWETATREFWEETGQKFTLQKIRSSLEPMAAAWVASGKYILYVCFCQTFNDIDLRYNLSREEGKNEKFIGSLRWVSIRSIYLGRGIRCLTVREGERTKTKKIKIPLHGFAASVLLIPDVANYLKRCV